MQMIHPRPAPDPFVLSPDRRTRPTVTPPLHNNTAPRIKIQFLQQNNQVLFPEDNMRTMDINSIFLIILNIFTIYHNIMAGILISVNDDNRVL